MEANKRKEVMTDIEYYHSLVNGARHTIGDFIRGVFKVTNENDAASFYRGCVESTQAQIDAGTWQSQATAEQAAKANIGWCFGEGMNSKRIEMWNRVCGADHPVFGLNLNVSPEEAIQAGISAGGGARSN